MTDLLSLLVQMGGTVEPSELRYQCRKHRLNMNGSLDALIEAGDVKRFEDGSVRAVRQVVKRPAKAKLRRPRQPPRPRPVHPDLRSSRRAFTPAERKVRQHHAAQLWREGWTTRMIAADIGVGVQTINDWLAFLRATGHDVPRRAGGRRASAPTPVLESR